MNVKINILGMQVVLNTWTVGNITVADETYEIQMVRFDEPSQHGIRNGRISKLYVTDTGRNTILNFDRGWDVYPKTAKGKAILAAIVKQFN